MTRSVSKLCSSSCVGIKVETTARKPAHQQVYCIHPLLYFHAHPQTHTCAYKAQHTQDNIQRGTPLYNHAIDLEHNCNYYCSSLEKYCMLTMAL